MANTRRKLLVATVGLAAVSYIVLGEACGGKTDGEGSSSGERHPTSGNLPGPPPPTATTPPTTGNLPSPPPTPPISGNLPSPPIMDASTDGPRDASNDQ